MRLTVGDPSGSHSERYNLVVGPITHQARQFGVVSSANYKFQAGNRYEVRITWQGCNKIGVNCGFPDYDYDAYIEAVSIPPGVIFEIEDPNGILGSHSATFDDVGCTWRDPFYAKGKVAYVNLIKVDVADIKFDHTSGDAGDGIDINDVTAPEWVKGGQNEPAAYKKNTDVTIKAKFIVSPPSSSITSAKIRATTTDGILGNLGEQTVNFSGGVSSPEYVTFTPSNATPISVSAGTVTWQWKAKDLNGGSSPEHNIGLSGPHTIYTVYDSPLCPASDYIKEHIDWACTNAQSSITPDEIADAIHLALDADPPLDGNEGSIETDGWELLLGSPYSGWCDHQARFMVRVLNLLGTTGTAYLTYASSDTVVTTYESKTQDDKIWFLKFDFDDDGEIDNNFEGSVSASSHFYAVWPSLESGSECGLLRKVGPDDVGATQRWVRTQFDRFGDPWVEHLPGTEEYPTCP